MNFANIPKLYMFEICKIKPILTICYVSDMSVNTGGNFDGEIQFYF